MALSLLLPTLVSRFDALLPAVALMRCRAPLGLGEGGEARAPKEMLALDRP